ncbi:MAG: inositol phosphorylceramide synthase [Methylotenera sp.]|nr:inositol phosphorylceramide synthase [Oligoflexia bacterium]
MLSNSQADKTRHSQISRLQALPRSFFRGVSQEARDWPEWWRRLSPVQKSLPTLLVLLYWWSLHLLGGFRDDHWNMGLIILVLCYAGRKARVLFQFLFPAILTAILYDSQRFYSDYIRMAVHVQEPYNFDRRFFGIQGPTGTLTPNEWCQLHTHPILDLITGFFYLFFIAIFVGICARFRFFLSRTGTWKQTAVTIMRESPRMMWSFFWLNMLGYSTYYWYPAAPPWYVAQYGLGPANMTARPSAAGCLRFDQILGTHFFTGMYGRSADIFGAVPSLHIAYPLVAVLFAFRFGAMRTFSIGFYLIMCFSAVYLNHHYILDILWGSTYAVLIVAILNAHGDRKLLKQDELSALS